MNLTLTFNLRSSYLRLSYLPFKTGRNGEPTKPSRGYYPTEALPHPNDLDTDGYLPNLQPGVPYRFSIDTLIPTQDKKTLRLIIVELSHAQLMSSLYNSNLSYNVDRISASIHMNPQWAMGQTFLQTIEDLDKKSRQWAARLNDLEKRLLLKPSDFPGDGRDPDQGKLWHIGYNRGNKYAGRYGNMRRC
ncbi:MAG: hypothetical protein Q9221_006738 [Calogaya cf. arnoldii]